MLDLIRLRFRESGLSIRQLSLRSGVAYSPVHAIVKGQRDPQLSTAERLCETLDLELRQKRKTKRKER